MTNTSHALAGAVIGKTFKDPYLIIAVAILSHFIMDRFRHGEYADTLDRKTTFKNTSWKIICDLSIGLSIITFFVRSSNVGDQTVNRMLLGIAISLLPDFFHVLYWKFRWKILKQIFDFHSSMHRYPRFSKEREWNFRNARNDLLISISAIIILFIIK